MDISSLVKRVESGELSLDELLEELKLRSSHADFADLDHSRKERCGFPEFVFGEGKTLNQLREITKEIYSTGMPVLITRIEYDSAVALQADYPDAEYSEVGRAFLLLPENFPTPQGRAVIVTAGTTDLPAALEAKFTLRACGCGVELLADSGVAGIHRILNNQEKLRSADVVIVVAGMEGALPSVVGGMVSSPVIALPTSVGYGTALGGLTAMFSMLNSCANGVTVMNIDNGFGAACAAARVILSANC